MIDLNRQFLERVVVWPGDANAPGWINLHYNSRNPDPSKNGGKDWVGGKPFKSVDKFISYAKWTETTHTHYNAWYCTSQQSESSTSRAGKPKAVRLAKNATWLKAIWIDVDVKAGIYATVQDAWAAISAFRKKVGLPEPTALVNSGGGLHVYWISDTPLSPDEWRSYAEGLKQLLLAEGVKCDSGLTTDSARLLRVPGTLNHKYTPPEPVRVLHLAKQDINFATDLAFLKKAAPLVAIAPATQSREADIALGFANAAPHAAFASLDPNEGRKKLLDPLPIFKECGFLLQALETGGEHYDNPLWNLSVLCTTFMEDGNAIAHKISKKHADYTPPGTQALFDRKMADRVDRNIGYPSCATIAGNGCKSCETCPLFAKGKSPLNIRPTFTAAVTAPAVPQSSGAKLLQLPPKYELNDKGQICYIEQKRDRDGNVEQVCHQLFHSIIDLPWVQKDPDVIHFRVSFDKGNWVTTSIRWEDWCGADIGKKLALAKIKYVPNSKKYLEQFFMAWLQKMHEASVAQTAQAFGWYIEGGQRKGFAYGGFIFKDDGSTPQAGMTDKETQKKFQPTGAVAPWYNACAYMTAQKRPELEAIIALSFAAPLMEMTGVVGAMLSAYGISGAGKSYALEVGAAVWGHPKSSKETQQTSPKSLEERLGATANLPVYWDEIHDKKAQQHCLDVLMLINAGVGGGKLDQNRNQRAKGTWCTLLGINSNLCFKEFVASKQLTHTAGLNRVLEYEVIKLANPVGMTSASAAARALIELHRNYGHVGLDYARILGQNHLAIQKRVSEVQQDLEKRLQTTEEDRFWAAIIAALLVGAEYANQLNAGLDRAALETFLLKVFAENRIERIEANVTPNAMVYAEDHLTWFLKDHGMASIWCEHAPLGTGRSAPISWRRLFPNAPLPEGIAVRFNAHGNKMLLSTRKFRAWCAKNELSSAAVEKSLAKNYSVIRDRSSLNAGTGLSGGQEAVIILDVTGHQDLIDMMSSQVNNTDLGASVGMDNAALDTGIVTPEGESADAQAVCV